MCEPVMQYEIWMPLAFTDIEDKETGMMHPKNGVDVLVRSNNHIHLRLGVTKRSFAYGGRGTNYHEFDVQMTNEEFIHLKKIINSVRFSKDGKVKIPIKHRKDFREFFNQTQNGIKQRLTIVHNAWSVNLALYTPRN